MKKGYRFKGIDWQELAEAWDVKLKDEDETPEAIEFLFEVLNRRDMEEMKAIANSIKRYLKQLIKQGHTHCNPLWEGLSKIEDDYVILQMTIPLLGYMWD